MRNAAPWILSLVFMGLFCLKTLENISMSHTIFRLIKSSDELQKADQELKSAAEKLLRECMK